MTFPQGDETGRIDLGLERHGASHKGDGQDPVGGTLKQSPGYAAGAAINVSSVTPATVAELTLTATGGTVIIMVTGSILEVKSAANVYNHIMYLFRDSTNITSTVAIGYLGAAVAIEAPMALVYQDQPSPGSHTYSVRMLYVAASTSGTPTGYANIVVLEYG